MGREGDASASVQSHCTGICLPHPRGLLSPKLISHLPPPGLVPLPSSGTVLLPSFTTHPKSWNLCGHRLQQEGKGKAGKGWGQGTTEEAGPGVGRHPSTSRPQVSGQQASGPSFSAAPTFIWAPQPYLSHQPGPTSNRPPSRLHSSAAPQDVGDKTCPQGPPGSHPPIPGLRFRSGIHPD